MDVVRSAAGRVARAALRGARPALPAGVRWRSTTPRRGDTRRGDRRRSPQVQLAVPPKPISVASLRRLVDQGVEDFASDTDTIKLLAGLGIVPSALHAVLASQSREVVRRADVDLGALPHDPPALVHAAVRCWAAQHGRTAAASRLFAPWAAIAAEFDAAGHEAVRRACTHAFLQWLSHRLRYVLEKNTGLRADAAIAIRASLRQLALLHEVTDLRVPENAYAPARTLTRQIHMHVGPTNSGKTHGALVALSRARTGLYCGPLRLLAHEVWERLNEGTISPQIPPRACNLRTGEEQRIVDPLAGLVSCTVEMADPNSPYDVAVIDEIQMIGDMQRGPAWTQAVLGLAAKELHLCGEASAVPLVRRLAALCGDVLHVHEYQRLTPLAVAPESLQNDLSKIQKGDCVVAFSRSAIFQLKKQIETHTQLQCAVAYGSLPPETKSEQAKLFNAGKLDVMVASDAIGMGLNLKIKRVIFDTLTKWNGSENVALSVSQIKQIAGRAGRYGTAEHGSSPGGQALTRHEQDMPLLHAALAAPTQPLPRAALQPASGLLESLALLLPFAEEKASASSAPASHGKARSLAALYQDMSLLAHVEPRSFVLANFASQQAIAPILEARSRNSLTHVEKEKWAHAPVNLRDERAVAWLGNAVELYARGELIPFEKCAEHLGTLEAEAAVLGVMQRAKARRSESGDVHAPLELFTSPADAEIHTIDTLMLLESHHRSLSLYLWLSYRFPLAFCFQDAVEQRKARTEDAIEFCLSAIRIQRARRLTKLGREHEVRPEHRHVVYGT